MKRISYLVLLPLYGACILVIYLYIQVLRRKVFLKQFIKFFVLTAVVGVITIYGVVGILELVYSWTASSFIDKYELVLVIVIGGYLMNLFTFVIFNKMSGKLLVNQE